MFDRARGARPSPDLVASIVSRRAILRGGAGAGLAAAALVATRRLTVFAQEASPSPSPLPVVASGLVNPRFITVAEDGTLYVSESGTGGDEQLFEPAAPGTPEASPAPAEPIGNRGTSGQVSKIAPDGTVSVVASGLPSYAFGIETTGPAGITLGPDGKIWLAVGGSGPGSAFLDELPNENSVVSIDPATGTVTKLADIGAYERANNPHPAAIDSNLYGIAVGADGAIYVADAGGNAVYHVDPTSGEITLLAVIEDIPAPEGAQGPPTLQAVPTGVTPNPAGGIYVGLLSGGPFPPGAAKILAIAEDGTQSDAATGLTMVTDVKVGPDGNLYACEISTNFLTEPPAPGNVVRIKADGTQEVVVDGLMLPNGIAFDAAGNLFIVAGSVGVAGPAGMVLRADGIAAPSA